MNFLNYFYFQNRNSKLIVLLSILGLLPFFFGLIDLLLNKNNLFFVINLPKYYGSIILTFLGAIYWGIILNDSHKNLIPDKVKTYIICWSIIPSLWSSLILIYNHNITIIVLAICYIIVQFVDEFVIKYFKFPIWYLFLRRLLTVMVILILLFSYFLVMNV
jgi:hypothetical protein|tara:strand:- start:2133 stop:2615 length:483 start_codon:yes stop_codon:yes gene_type:complete